MRRSFLALIPAIVSLCVAPAAGAYNGVDGIGIFFDTAGTQSCIEGVPENTPLMAYVCAMNVSQAAGVSGWELCVVVDGYLLTPPVYTLVPDPSGNPLNVFPPPQFQVGFPLPMPYQPVMPLLTIQIFYSSGPIKYGVGPTTPTSFWNPEYFPEGPGPGYAAGDDPGILKRLTPITDVPVPGSPRFFYVAFANDSADCPITPVEQTSWGGVKALYR